MILGQKKPRHRRGFEIGAGMSYSSHRRVWFGWQKLVSNSALHQVCSPQRTPASY